MLSISVPYQFNSEEGRAERIGELKWKSDNRDILLYVHLFETGRVDFENKAEAA